MSAYEFLIGPVKYKDLPQWLFKHTETKFLMYHNEIVGHAGKGFKQTYYQIRGQVVFKHRITLEALIQRFPAVTFCHSCHARKMNHKFKEVFGWKIENMTFRGKWTGPHDITHVYDPYRKAPLNKTHERKIAMEQLEKFWNKGVQPISMKRTRPKFDSKFFCTCDKCINIF